MECIRLPHSMKNFFCHVHCLIIISTTVIMKFKFYWFLWDIAILVKLIVFWMDYWNCVILANLMAFSLLWETVLRSRVAEWDKLRDEERVKELFSRCLIATLYLHIYSLSFQFCKSSFLYWSLLKLQNLFNSGITDSGD